MARLLTRAVHGCKLNCVTPIRNTETGTFVTVDNATRKTNRTHVAGDMSSFFAK